MKITNAIQFFYRDVGGYLYHNPGNKHAIILCKGGPSMGDDGKKEIYSKISSKLGYSVIVPDYLGSGRSGGLNFTIHSSVKTISIIEEMLVKNDAYVDCWSNTKRKLNIKHILLLGSSWGGTMVGLYFHFYPQSCIQNIVTVAGVLDYNDTEAKKYGQETDREFWAQITNGWKYYYRNVERSDWKPLVLQSDSSFNPMNHMATLQHKRVLLVHGTKDKVVSWQRSREYYDRFRRQHPQADITLKLFSSNHMNIRNMRVFNYITSHFPKK
ncbi:alpha/beta fold hydrolase [Candidatus Woesebacteria bacterium]|nr:alpha/beta fold hydrolase [Candidatus Woesebacteria bacterium]